MVIVSKCRTVIINTNQVMVYINDDKDEIYATYFNGTNMLLGEYEDEDVTKTVFNEIIEAIENCEEVFHMPE